MGLGIGTLTKVAVVFLNVFLMRTARPFQTDDNDLGTAAAVYSVTVERSVVEKCVGFGHAPGGGVVCWVVATARGGTRPIVARKPCVVRSCHRHCPGIRTTRPVVIEAPTKDSR